MFVKEQLNNNPLANAEAVNKAWRAAGIWGTIGPPFVARCDPVGVWLGTWARGP